MPRTTHYECSSTCQLSNTRSMIYAATLLLTRFCITTVVFFYLTPRKDRLRLDSRCHLTPYVKVIIIETMSEKLQVVHIPTERPQDSFLVRALNSLSRQAINLAGLLHHTPTTSRIPSIVQHPASSPAITERIYSWMEGLDVSRAPDAQEIQETQHWDPTTNTIRTTTHTRATGSHLISRPADAQIDDLLTPMVAPEDSVSNRMTIHLMEGFWKDLERMLRDAFEGNIDGAQVLLKEMKSEFEMKERQMAINE